MYIRRAKISSRIYIKHQYWPELEYESMCDNTYKVITERDIILQVHYIMIRYKRKIYIWTIQKMLTSWEGITRASRKSQEQKELGLVSLLRETSLIFGGGLHFNPSFKTWTCKSRESEAPQQVARWMPSGVQIWVHVYRYIRIRKHA